MTITPEQAAHDTRDVIVSVTAGFMTDPACYARGAELGFEEMDFYVAGRGGAPLLELGLRLRSRRQR